MRFLKQIDVDGLRVFRGTWDDGALYATKNVERIMRACGLATPSRLAAIG